MSSETSIPGGRPFPSLRELTGTVIDGRYEVGQLLGCGGMGAVYEAMQLRLDRRVAIKILNPVYMHRDDYVTRFMREAKAASRIRHENVVQVLDFGELASGSVYSVMEFLEGRDLAQLLQQETKLPWPRTRDLLLQMSRGLKAAHAEGVIHRDIKPANLFLVPDPEENRDILKVLDFGIARLQTSTSHTAGLTGTAELLGTPSYMAPELARGRAANPRSEVYSVGVVAYRMITGHLPFEGQTAFDVLFRSATEPAPPLRNHDPTVPPAIEALVLRMLAKDPEERFPDMGTLYREITAIDEHGRPQRSAVLATGPQATPPAGPATVVDARAPSTSPSPSPAAVPSAPSIPIPTAPAAAMGPMLREHTLVSTEPGGGPAVVVPPPLTVSASTRAALAATRAARAAASGHAHRLDPATGSGARVMPLPAGDSGSGPIGVGPVTPDPRGGDPTHPMPGAEATPAPGSSVATHAREGATIPVTDAHVQADSASGNVPFLPGGSGTAMVPSGTHDLHELRAIQGTTVPRWLVATVFGVVAVVGIIAIAATRGDDPPTPEPAAPTVIAAPSVVPDDDDRPASSPAGLPASSPDAEGSPVDAPSDPQAEPASASAPEPEPEPESEMVIDDEPPPDPEPAAPSATSKPPKPRPPVAEPVAPKHDPEPRAKPKSEPAPDKGPSDATIVKRLQRQAERKCGMLLGGEPLTVKFGIGKDGEVLAPRASRSGAAAKCVLGLLDGAQFPPGKMRAEDLKL